MIGVIRDHNLLTRYRFVIVEYLAVSAPLGALGAYYLAVGRWADAGIWIVIVANCLLIAVIAARSLRARGRDFGTLPTCRREFPPRDCGDHSRLSWRRVALIPVTFVAWPWSRWSSRNMALGAQIRGRAT